MQKGNDETTIKTLKIEDRQLKAHPFSRVTSMPPLPSVSRYPYRHSASLNWGDLTMISESIKPGVVCRVFTCTWIRASSPQTSPVYFRSSTRYPPARSTFPGAEKATVGRSIAVLLNHSKLGILKSGNAERCFIT